MNRIFRSALRPRLYIQPPRSPLAPCTYRSFTKAASSLPPHSALWYTRLGALFVAHGLIWSFLGTYIVGETIPLTKGLKNISIIESDDISVFEPIADNNKIVQMLRDNPDYVEMKPWGALTEEQRKKTLTAGLLGGNGKIQYNRIWLHRNDGSTVLVLGLGKKLTGYPDIIHGGLIATIIDEALGRTASRVLPTRNVVTAQLTVNYKRPTKAQRQAELAPRPHEFIVLRTWVVEHTDRKAIVQGRLEDSEGRTLAESDGIFVVPRGWELAELPQGI